MVCADGCVLCARARRLAVECGYFAQGCADLANKCKICAPMRVVCAHGRDDYAHRCVVCAQGCVDLAHERVVLAFKCVF